MQSDNYLMVVALDFGTTYSGYAFSMRDDFEKEPLKIHANNWSSGGQALSSLKTPTCLLLNKEKECLAFGYEAENMYTDIVMDGETDDHYYFYRFKMNLHNNKNITKDMVLEDVTGKPLPAIEVFKLSIQALVDHLLKMLETRGTGVQKNEVRWVLTVPAIWTDVAKKFMRTSAELAGIPRDNLIMALEPETASIYCQYLPTEKLLGAVPGFAMTTKGTQYMVVDIGGGTADITVHEKSSNGQLKELFRATGNDYGGTSVDKMFLKMLEDVFGETILSSLKEEDPLGYLSFIREFEAAKRSINEKKTGKINILIPFVALEKQCQLHHKKSLQSVIECSPYANVITLFKDKIRINPETIKELFKTTVDSILSLMKEILINDTTKGVTQLLLVGGFSDCHLLQNAIRETFTDKRIIVPQEAGLAVLKGAVLFGHRPDYVQSRVMRYTYGIKTNVPFVERRHDAKHRVIMDGEVKCDNIFSIIVEKDKQVEAGTIVKKSYFTPYRNQEVMDFMIYTSTNHYPSYIDDEGCELLCKPTITFPDPCEEQRWVDVEYTFGNTEIGLKAVDRMSGKEITTNLHLI